MAPREFERKSGAAHDGSAAKSGKGGKYTWTGEGNPAKQADDDAADSKAAMDAVQEEKIQAMLAKGKSIPKPDPKEKEVALTAIEDEVKALGAKRDAAQKKLETLYNAGSEFRDERNAIKAKFDVIKKERDALFKKRDALFATLKTTSEGIKDMREKSKKAKDGMKYRSIDEINKRILELERKQQYESMSLKDEKNLLKDLKDLNAQKRTVEKINAMEDDMKSKGTDKGIKEQIADLKIQVADASERLSVQRSQLEAIDAKTQGHADIPALKKERDDLRKQQDAKRAEKAVILTEWRKKNDEWWMFQQAVRKQRDEERKKEQEEWEKRKEEQRKEREAELLTQKPWMDEIALCDVLSAYLRKLDGSSAAPAAGAAAAAKTDSPALEGMQAVRRGRDEDDTFMIMGGAKGKGAKKGKGTKKKKGKLMHSIDMLGSFQLLQLTPPTSTEGVPAALEALKNKRDYYDVLPRDLEADRAKLDAMNGGRKDRNKPKSSGKKQQAAAQITAEAFPELPAAAAK